ncbi:major tail protein [Halalkalibacterium ligniniphilum]|uniref:major tail protein n=1 Tax=Halalkalibacterium ligniniphilum TaxID=1134413 RepID=UPI000347AA00|nr:major tail protein [Halalkalibacterium ligniniphilum]
MAIKGLKNLHYAIITAESDTETTYSEVKPLGPAIAFNIQPSINRANLRADDQVLFSDTSKGPIAVTLNTAYLDKQVEADLLGKTVHANGLSSDNVNDDAPYVAIGGQAEDARGGAEFFWIYRVKFAPAEENKETKQETPTYQTPNLTGEAIPRMHDGEEKLKAWDGDSTITDKSVFDKWFTEVIDKNWVPTV